ncbi:MAG: ABC transporter ATP-binding protein [Burkholderiales bacterium]
MSLLQVDGLYRRFGGVEAVRDVSFRLEAGEILALIGPNGAGKSTCFDLLNGQLRADRGRVWLGGRDITALKPRERWALGVGRTFQITATYASMSVRENVQMVLLSAAHQLNGFWTRASRCHAADADALLEKVGMLAQAQRPCGLLAYGDVKRVELAMALASRPRLLLMDEPTAGMAPGERDALMVLTAALAKEQGIGVLFTEHSMDVVFAHAHRILVMARGRLIAEGDPASVRENADVQAIYFGTAATFRSQAVPS